MDNTNNDEANMPDTTIAKMPEPETSQELAPTLALRPRMLVANQEGVEEPRTNQFGNSCPEDETFYDDLGEPTLTSTTAITPPSNASAPSVAWIPAFEAHFAGYRTPQEARAIEMALHSTGPTGFISDSATITHYHDDSDEEDNEGATVDDRYQAWIEEHGPTGLAFWEGRTQYVVTPVENFDLNNLQTGPYERCVFETPDHIVVRIHLRDSDKSDTFGTFDALGLKITNSAEPRAQSPNIWIDARSADGQTIATALDPETIECILINGNTFAMPFKDLLTVMFRAKCKQSADEQGDIDITITPPSTRYLTTAEASEQHPNVRASRGMLIVADSRVPNSRSALKNPCHCILPLDYLPFTKTYEPGMVQVSCDRCSRPLATFESVTERPFALRRALGEVGDTYRVDVIKRGMLPPIHYVTGVKQVWITADETEFYMQANDQVGQHTHDCRPDCQGVTAPRTIDANDSFYAMAGDTSPEFITNRLTSLPISENQPNRKGKGRHTSAFSIPLSTSSDKYQLTSPPKDDSDRIPSWFQPGYQSSEDEPVYSEDYKSYLKSMYSREPNSTCGTQPVEQRPRAHSALTS